MNHERFGLLGIQLTQVGAGTRVADDNGRLVEGVGEPGHRDGGVTGSDAHSLVVKPG